MLTDSSRRRHLVLTALAFLLAAVAAWSLTRGVIPTTMAEVFTALPQAWVAVFSAADQPPQLVLILAEIRIPRLLLGMLVGAGLAVSGAVMQGLFRNPLADPGLLGVSSGAALGAVAVIVLVGGSAGVWQGVVVAWGLPLAAFGGGLAGMLVVYRLSLAGGKTDVPTMLLAGIAVNAIAAAVIGLLTYIADDAELRDLIFWSLGSLEVTDRLQLLAAVALILPPLVLIPRYANALNANLLGEREAGHLGLDMERVKFRLILLTSLVVGISVSLSGIIGFVGLVVPHVLRLLVGPDHRLLLPGAALLGAALLCAADVVARTAVAPAEIPIGVITALLGGPFFLWLLVRYQRRRVALC